MRQPRYQAPFRVISILLIFSLIFPAHIQASDFPRDLPRTNPDRENLLKAIHQTSWEVTYFIKKQMPYALKFRMSDYHSLFQPYVHCEDSPFPSLPQSTEDIDRSLVSLFQKIRHYLEKHRDNFAQIRSLLFDSRTFQRQMITSKNGSTCEPLLWPNGSASAIDWQRPEEILGSQNPFEPFVLDLARKSENAPFTLMEYRILIGISALLIRYRNLIQKHIKAQGHEIASAPPPVLSVSKEIGQKILVHQGTIDEEVASRRVAQNLLKATTVQKEIPRFVSCANGEYCLSEGKPERVGFIDEDILIQLYAKNPSHPDEIHHGGYLEMARVSQASAYLMELATMKSQLPKSEAAALTLPEACSVHRDPALQDALETYDSLSTASERFHWLQKFGEAVESLVGSYRQGRRSLPLPQSNVFYTQAQDIAKRFIQEHLESVATQTGGSLALKARALKLEILSGMIEIPFEDRLRDTEETGAQSLSKILSDKIGLWYLLLQKDLETLSTSRPDARLHSQNILREMLKEVVLSTLVDSLKFYALGFLRDSEFDLGDAEATWERTFRLEFQRVIREAVDDVNRMVHEVSEGLLNTPELYTPHNVDEEVYRSADERVRQIVPLATASVQADQMMRYMNNHLRVMGGPENIFPGEVPFLGSENYHRLEAAISDVSNAPACFQIPDGEGRENQYPILNLNGLKVEDYESIKKGFMSLVVRHEERLIEQLKKDTPYRKALTDEWVRATYRQTVPRLDSPNRNVQQEATVPDVRTLAKLVIHKFIETLEADPLQDEARSAFHRTLVFQDLKRWLLSYDFDRAYPILAKNFAKRIYHDQLESVLELPSPDRALDSVLKSLPTRLTYFNTSVSPHSLIEAHSHYRATLLRMERLHSQIQAAQRGAVESKIFERGEEGWAAFCELDRSRCESRVQEGTRPYEDNEIETLWQSRFWVWTENSLKPFLGAFGRYGRVYEGNTQNELERALIAQVKDQILKQAWVGFRAVTEMEPRFVDAVNGAMEGFLVEVSRRAHRTPQDENSLLISLRPLLDEIAQRLNLFERWKDHTAQMKQEVVSSIRRGDFKNHFPQVVALLNLEYTFLTSAVLPIVRESEADYFYSKLSSLIFPSRQDFRREVIQGIENASHPAPDPELLIRDLEQRRTDLQSQWARLEASRGLTESLKNRIRLELLDIEHTLERSRDRLTELLQLDRILENYLGEVPLAIQARAALKVSTSLDLWNSFHEKEFLNASIGEWTAQEVLEDLQSLERSGGLLDIDESTAKTYLSAIADFCGKAIQESAILAFRSQYNRTLYKEINEWVTGRKRLEISLRFIRLGQLKKRSINYWSNLRNVFRRDGGIPALVSTFLPTAEEFCEGSVQEATDLNTQIAQDLREKGRIDRITQERYWKLAQVFSERSISLESEWSPFLVQKSDGPLEPLFFSGAPTISVRPQHLNGIPPIPSSYTLHAFLGLSGLSNEFLEAVLGKDFFQSLPLDFQRSIPGTQRALSANFLPLEKQKAFLEILKGYFLEYILSPPQVNRFQPHELFSDITRSYNSNSWSKEINSALQAWHYLKDEFKLSEPPSPTGTQSPPMNVGFSELTQYIFDLLLFHTPYRLKRHILYLPTASDPQGHLLLASQAEFRTYKPVERIRLVEDIRSVLQRRVPLLPGHRHTLKGPLQAVLFYADHFIQKNTLPDSVERWRQSFIERSSRGELAYTAPKPQFKWHWLPLGAEGEAEQEFQNYFEILNSDAVARESFEERRKVPFRSLRRHVWQVFDSLSTFQNSLEFKKFTSLLHLSDKNTLAKPIPKTYAYFLATLSWLTYRFGRIPNPSAPIRERPFGEAEKAGLFKDIVEVIGLDTNDFQSWETLLKRRGKPQDFFLVASHRKMFLSGLKDRRFLHTRLPTTQVTNPGGTPQYPFRNLPLDLKPLEAMTRQEEWLQRFRENSSYLLLRGNNEDFSHSSLYYSLASTNSNIVGEHSLHRNPFQVTRQEPSGSSGRTYTLQDNGQRTSAEEIVRWAAQRGIFTHKEEVKDISKVWEALSDFIEGVNSTVRRYPFENSGSLGLISGAQTELQKRLHAFANQSEIGWRPPISTLNAEEAAPRAIWEALTYVRARLLDGKSQTERDRILRLLNVFRDYYRTKMQSSQYLHTLRIIAENNIQGLRELCGRTDLKEVRNDADFEAKKELLKKTNLQFLDGLHQYLIEFAPRGLSSGTRRLLEQLKDEKTDLKRIQENYIEPGVRWTIALSLLYMVFENPTWTRAALSKPMTRRAVLFLTSALGLYFGYDAYDEWREDYEYAPYRNTLLAELSQREFMGFLPGVSDLAAESIEIEERALLENQRSRLRWAFRIWNVAISWQLLGPFRQFLKGGAAGLLARVAPETYFKTQTYWMARRLGIPASTLRNLSPADAVQILTDRLEQKIATYLGSQGIPSHGYFTVRSSMLQFLKRDAKAQIKSLCRDLGLEFNTATRTVSPLSGRVLVPNRDLERLISILEQLESRAPHINRADLAYLMSGKGYPANRLTHRAWYFTGLPNSLSPWGGYASIRLTGLQSTVEAGEMLPKLLAQHYFSVWRNENAALFSTLLAHFRQELDPQMTLEDLIQNMLHKQARHHSHFTLPTSEEAAVVEEALFDPFIHASSTALEGNGFLTQAKIVAAEGRLIASMAGIGEEHLTLDFCRLLADSNWRGLAHRLRVGPSGTFVPNGREEPVDPDEIRILPDDLRNARPTQTRQQPAHRNRSIGSLLPSAYRGTAPTPRPDEFTAEFAEYVVSQAPPETRSIVARLLEYRVSSWNYSRALEFWRADLQSETPVATRTLIAALEHVTAYTRALELRLPWKNFNGRSFQELMLLSVKAGEQAIITGEMRLVGLTESFGEGVGYAEACLGIPRSSSALAIENRFTRLSRAIDGIPTDNPLVTELITRWRSRLHSSRETLLGSVKPPNIQEIPGSFPESIRKEKSTVYTEYFKRDIRAKAPAAIRPLLDKLLEEGAPPESLESALRWWMGRTHISQATRTEIETTYNFLIDAVLQSESGLFFRPIPAGIPNPFRLSVDGNLLRPSHYHRLYGRGGDVRTFEIANETLGSLPRNSTRAAIESRFRVLHEQISQLEHSEWKTVALDRIQKAKEALLIDVSSVVEFQMSLELGRASADQKALGERLIQILKEAPNAERMLAQLTLTRRDLISQAALGETPVESLDLLDKFSHLTHLYTIVRLAEINGIARPETWIRSAVNSLSHIQLPFRGGEAHLFMEKALQRLQISIGGNQMASNEELAVIAERIQGALAQGNLLPPPYMKKLTQAYETLLAMSRENGYERHLLELGEDLIPLPFELLHHPDFVSHPIYRWYVSASGAGTGSGAELARDIPIVLFGNNEALRTINVDAVLAFIEARNERFQRMVRDAFNHSNVRRPQNIPLGPRDELINELIQRHNRAAMQGMREHAGLIRSALERLGMSAQDRARDLVPITPPRQTLSDRVPGEGG